MRYERDGYSVESAIRKGRELPGWYEEFNDFDLSPADVFFLTAFKELGTCRNSAMGLGDIPWDKIWLYGEKHGLTPETIDILVIVIRQMDEVYRKWHDAEQKRRSKQKAGG